MDLFKVIPIAVGLAMDAFSVSLAAGAAQSTSGVRAKVRLSFHFGLFQFMMPVIGWYLGTQVASIVTAVDHWLAFGLLAYVGVKMIRSGLSSEATVHKVDPSKGLTMVFLSVATSIDAFAVGLSLAFLNVDIWYPSILIGVITMALSLVGLGVGHRLGLVFGKRMEVIGGSFLCLMGLYILVSELIA